MAWDAFGYYLYLPATFIYQDPGLHKQESWLDEVYAQYEPSPTAYQVVDITRNKRVIKYPLGKALLDAPAFLVGHLIALSTEAPADGFSWPYQRAMWIWNLLLLSAGILALLGALRSWFSDKVSAILILCIGLGTNYLLTAWLSSGLVHGVLFGLTATVLWLTAELFKKPDIKKLTALFLVLALMCVIRPTEVFIVFIPALFLLPKYFTHLRANWKWAKFFQVILPGFLVGMLQLVYWKYTSNQWFFYSYNNAGEGLDFWQPHTLDFLFSFRKGWLVYSPLFILLIPGLFALFKWKKSLFWPVLVFFSLFLWISSSWSNWWYAESFGQRAMVQIYPILAVILGALLVQWRYKIKILVLAFASLCVVLNLFQSWQFLKGVLDPSRITSSYYWEVFGKTDVPEGAYDMLLIDRNMGGARAWEGSDGYHISPLVTNLESGAHFFPEGSYYLVESHWPVDSLLIGDHFWVRARVTLRVDSAHSSGDSPKIVLATYAKHNDASYGYLALEVFPLNGVCDTSLYFLSPEPTRNGDHYYFQIWNPEGVPIVLEKLELSHLSPSEN